MGSFGDKQKQHTGFTKILIKQVSESLMNNGHNGDNKKKLYEAFLSRFFTTTMPDLLNRV